MKINVNDKVLISSNDEVIGAYNGEVATVKRIYPDVVPPIAYVEIEADLVARTLGLKVPIADLVLIPDKSKNEIPDGAREITKEDFDAAVENVTDPDSFFSESNLSPMSRMVKAVSVKIVAGYIAEEIFKDRDVITMTEDAFVAALWDGCNPTVISGIVGNRMSAFKCSDVALTSFIGLNEIVPILFGEYEK